MQKFFSLSIPVFQVKDLGKMIFLFVCLDLTDSKLTIIFVSKRIYFSNHTGCITDGISGKLKLLVTCPCLFYPECLHYA